MRQWEEVEGVHFLSFEPFYEEIVPAKVFEDDDGGWCYSSKVLGAENEYLGSNTLDEAKGEVEDLISEYYHDQIDYYTALSKEFDERT